MLLPPWTDTLETSHKEKLKTYAEELFHFNKKIVLYSRRQKPDFCWKMILDSYLAGKILLQDNFHSIIADIGSGAGFPGIVLAVLDTKKEFWLFEPNKKRAAFLEYICWKMDLKNTYVKNRRIQEEEGQLSCAVSKAFLSLGQRLAVAQSAFKPGAHYYHLQSLNWKKQWEEASPLIQKKWFLEEIQRYSHPPFLSERVLLRAVFGKKPGY